MTVTANTTRNDYTAGSAQSEYDYTFQLNEAADVDVYLDGVKQTLNTHYVVQNVGNASGGTIVFTLEDENGDPIHPTQGAIINIVMAMDLDRDTNYQPSGAFLAADVNNDFDRLWLATNQQQTAVNRALRLKDTDVTTSSMELPLKDDRKGKLLAFNATTGDPEATTNNQSNWDTAYNNSITSASFSGSTLTLGQQDGGTITASHTPYLPIAGGTLTGDLRFNDNDVLKFGDSNDLRIYHTGTSSIIQDVGTGDLALLGTNLAFANGAGTSYYAAGTEGGAFTLYYNGSEKLATTSGGISVTGTITATGYNNSNWDTAYNNMITAVDFNNSTLTLTQQDGGTLTTTINGNIGQWTTSGSDIYYNSGNVGIGTTNPATSLHVLNASDSQIRLSQTGEGSYDLGVIDGDKFAINRDGLTNEFVMSSGNVGIGTDSPSTFNASNGAGNLVVGSGSGAEGITVYSGTTSNGALCFADGTSSTDTYKGYVQYNHNTNSMQFATGHIERMRIDSSGNLLVGKTSATATDLGCQIENDGQIKTTSNGQSALTLNRKTSDGPIAILQKDGTTVGSIGTASSGITFASGGSTERMRIDSSGNVGIGVTSPTGKVQIYKGGQSSYQTYTATNSGLILQSYQSQGNPYTKTSDIVAGSDGTVPSEIRLLTRTAGQSSVDERMRIDSSGKVGIGTTSPAANLHVDASAPEFRLSQSGTAKVRLRTTGDNYINTGQNLGIGTTSPNGKLEVSSADFDTLYLTRSTAGSATILMKNSSNNGGLVQSLGNGGLSFFSTVSDSSSERMRIDSSGRVGIGITNPSSYWAQADNLVVGGTGNDGITIKSATVGNGRIAFTDTASSTAGLNDGGLISYSHNDDALSFQTSGSERLRINSSGNVGIGTTSPAQELHIASSGEADIRLQGSSSENYLDIFHNASDFGLWGTGTQVLKLATNGTERLRIDSSGNVGIGTTSPSESLHVSGVARADTLRAGGGSNSAPGIAFINSTTTGFTNPAVATLGFVAGGQERIRINSVGNVAIGTTIPYEKLHVNGRVRASSVRCTSNGSYFHYSGFMGVAGIEVRHASSSSTTDYQNMIEFENISAGTVGSIKSNGTSTQYNTSSDKRMKENIQDAGDAGAKIDAIQIRQFDWKDSNHHEDFGVIAQELQPVAPEAVSEGYTEEDMWSVDYSKLVPTLIKEIQSLRNRVAELEKK